jgi:hypothetical protein
MFFLFLLTKNNILVRLKRSPFTKALNTPITITHSDTVFVPYYDYKHWKGKFKVCKSVHHHTIQVNDQLDAAISPVYYLTFIYSSTCFGRPLAHHQELNNCSSNLWFYLRGVVIAVLLVVVTELLPPRSEGKTRGCYCSCWAPDNGREDARNMLSCK